MKKKMYFKKRMKRGEKITRRSKFKINSEKQLMDLMYAEAWARFSDLCSTRKYEFGHFVWVRL